MSWWDQWVILYWEGIENLVLFCVQFESQQCGGTWYGEAHKWQTDTANIFTNLPSPSKAGFETVHKYAMAMDISPHSSAPNFPYWEDIQNLHFGSIIWETIFVEHKLSEIHKCLSNVQGSSFYLLNASKKGFEALHKQWMSLLAGQHPIFCTERVSQMWHFACNLRANLGRKWPSGTNNW